MSTIEEDVERVRAITAVLSGPQTVWVAKWQDRLDEGFELFVSEAGARKRLLDYLNNERESLDWDEEEFHAVGDAIEAGRCDKFNNGDDIWCSIDTEIVNP